MEIKPMGVDSILLCFAAGLVCLLPIAYGFDSLDPDGNITIKWDVMQRDTNGATNLRVSIFNYQLFRHIDQPGWRLSWTWPGKEVIWQIQGAEATEQGNCSSIKGATIPHCCEKTPAIVDLLPGAPYNMQATNCCKGGVLPSITQGPDKFGAAFEMTVGDPSNSSYSFLMPDNFNLGLPGYTCGIPLMVKPSKFVKDGGRRRTQALATYNVTCLYSQFRASPAPTCCVSMSAFYSKTIVPCQQCSCGCQQQPGSNCVKPGGTPSLLQLPNEEQKPVVQCSSHMCPIRVHWHVKESYKLYWRVKITVTNLNYAKNYSEWNLVALHPNMQNVTQVFSFNYMPIDRFGHSNDTGMFYGIEHYNDVLLQCGSSGNVQTEMLFQKDPGVFTFSQGWAFPRKISFNGDQCVMPSPDEYPKLPNIGSVRLPAKWLIILSLSWVLVALFQN